MNQTSNLCQTDFTGSFAELFSQSSYLSNSQFLIPNSQFSNAHGFTGRYLDSETSLWYFRARYFDNEMGRFISRDPLGFVDGMSLYNGYFAERFNLDLMGLSNGSSEARDRIERIRRQIEKRKKKEEQSTVTPVYYPTNLEPKSSCCYVECNSAGYSEAYCQFYCNGGDCPVPYFWATDDAGKECYSSKIDTVTLYIDMPSFGINSLFTFGIIGGNLHNFDTGHTFLGLGRDSSSTSGSVVRLGFYPVTAWFGGENDSGSIQDDTEHPYEIKKTFKACPQSIEKLVEIIKRDIDSPPTYNLLGTQCTSWACDTFEKAGFRNPGGFSPFTTGIYNW